MTRMVNPGLWPLNKDLVLAGVTGQVLESHVARQRTLKPSLATRPLGRMRFPVKEPDDQELLKTQVLNSIDNLLPSSPGKIL